MTLTHQFHDPVIAAMAAAAAAVDADMSYTDIISRTGGTDPLVPEPIIAEVIAEMPQQSALMARARRVPMSARTVRQPVLSLLPNAYWLTGDTGLKQTSDQEWKNVFLTAEELAVIVPIPQAYLDDAAVPLWDEVRPLITEAMGAAIDLAGIFGVGAPATWSTPIYPGIVAAGNLAAPTPDPGVGVAQLGVELAKDGFAANGFACAPGFVWNLVAFRTAQGVPIYQPDLTDSPEAGNLYGYPLNEAKNGAWDSNLTTLIAGDWTKAIVGLRQDITFTMFTEGVITDTTGKVLLNLMQQDTVALRCVMRLGFATANPVTRLRPNGNGYPFAALGAIAALSS